MKSTWKVGNVAALVGWPCGVDKFEQNNVELTIM
jgi:hypothetical protein